MQTRPTLRQYRQHAHRLAKAYQELGSFRKVARTFGVVTKAGDLNPRLVEHLMDGYRPTREETIERCGISVKEPMPIIHDEPARRVLTGAWKIGKRWVSPEEFCGVRS